jgi:DNA-binding CsgD family transcriptional regulator
VAGPAPENDTGILDLAEQVCTAKRFEALRLVAQGYGARRIARARDITPQAVTARLDSAYRRMRAKLETT